MGNAEIYERILYSKALFNGYRTGSMQSISNAEFYTRYSGSRLPWMLTGRKPFDLKGAMRRVRYESYEHNFCRQHG